MLSNESTETTNESNNDTSTQNCESGCDQSGATSQVTEESQSSSNLSSLPTIPMLADSEGTQESDSSGETVCSPDMDAAAMLAATPVIIPRSEVISTRNITPSDEAIPSPEISKPVLHNPAESLDVAEAIETPEIPEPTIASFSTAEATTPESSSVEAVKIHAAPSFLNTSNDSATEVSEPVKVVEAPSEESPIAETPAIEVPAETESSKTPDDEPTKKEDDGVLRFRDLPLKEELQKAIEDAGYDTPTPIQAEIIPHVLSGRDVVAQSQTGSGKTAAFALPILQRLNKVTRKPEVLVLAPTRELAIQVAKSFSTYSSRMKNFAVAAIYGGQDYEPQLKQLRRGVNVVVGTPGRVIDHIKRGTLDLSNIKCLVLDEADEMLNMGFLEDVEFVLEHAPPERQIALFSATMPKPIRNIAERYLTNPAKVTIQQKTMTAESIRQRAVFVSHRNKVDLLVKFLEAEQADGVIVFTRTRDTTTTVAEQLCKAGLSAVALNGDMPQKTRERTIERLKSGNLDILVATDVAARGLDVSRISHVFNFDLPEGSESYVHRVGRTGRAGRKGEAIIFLTRSQMGRLRMIERVTKQPIEIVEAPKAAQINEMRIQRFKEKIATTIEKRDLSFFKRLITETIAETGLPVEAIAAAIADIGQNGRPFLSQDRPERAERSGRNKRDRSDRPERGGGRRPRQSGPPSSGMTRFRLAVGRRDGVRPGNIVGAIANEAGIAGENIGPITIHDSYSTVDLPSGMPQDVCDSLQDTRVAGRQLKLRPARDSDTQDRPRRGKGGFSKHAKGKGGKRKANDAPSAQKERGGKRFEKVRAGSSERFKSKKSGGKFSNNKKKSRT